MRNDPLLGRYPQVEIRCLETPASLDVLETLIATLPGSIFAHILEF